jgi:hypothetical protein
VSSTVSLAPHRGRHIPGHPRPRGHRLEHLWSLKQLYEPSSPPSAAPLACHRQAPPADRLSPWSATLGETPTSPTPKSVPPPHGESPCHLPHRPRASSSSDLASGASSRHGQGQLPCSSVWATSSSWPAHLDGLLGATVPCGIFLISLI